MLSVLINTHLLLASRDAGVKRYFFASSACVYNADKQVDAHVSPLREEDAYPAMPEDGYGWEKLFSERMCRHFREDFGLETRVARFHNVYGPLGTYDGGREKAPAAICRKIIEAKTATRSRFGATVSRPGFMYIDDCLRASWRIMESDYSGPINLGSSELVTIDQLVDIVEQIAGSRARPPTRPRRSQRRPRSQSDNTMIRSPNGLGARIPLRVGMDRRYRWIWNQIASSAPMASGDR